MSLGAVASSARYMGAVPTVCQTDQAARVDQHGTGGEVPNRRAHGYVDIQLTSPH